MRRIKVLASVWSLKCFWGPTAFCIYTDYIYRLECFGRKLCLDGRISTDLRRNSRLVSSTWKRGKIFSQQRKVGGQDKTNRSWGSGWSSHYLQNWPKTWPQVVNVRISTKTTFDSRDLSFVLQRFVSFVSTLFPHHHQFQRRLLLKRFDLVLWRPGGQLIKTGLHEWRFPHWGYPVSLLTMIILFLKSTFINLMLIKDPGTYQYKLIKRAQYSITNSLDVSLT